MLVYLYSYALTQFLLFFVRDNLIVSFFGLNWGLKQAQWTSIVVLIVLLPITYLVLRSSKPLPNGEVAATYGIPQKPVAEDEISSKKSATQVSVTTESEASDTPFVTEEM